MIGYTVIFAFLISKKDNTRIDFSLTVIITMNMFLLILLNLVPISSDAPYLETMMFGLLILIFSATLFNLFSIYYQNSYT